MRAGGWAGAAGCAAATERGAAGAGAGPGGVAAGAAAGCAADAGAGCCAYAAGWGACAAGDAAATWPLATFRSRIASRSASDSRVRSVSGRAILVKAISRTSRWLVAVRISLEASPSTVSARATRSAEPNAAASARKASRASPVALTTPAASGAMAHT